MVMVMKQHRKARAPAGDGAEFGLGHLGEGLALMLHGGEQHDCVVYRTADDAADQQPEKARQVAVLGRQDRAHQRAGGGDGREVLAEVDPLVGRHIVLAIFQLVGGVTSLSSARSTLRTKNTP